MDPDSASEIVFNVSFEDQDFHTERVFGQKHNTAPELGELKAKRMDTGNDKPKGKWTVSLANEGIQNSS